MWLDLLDEQVETVRELEISMDAFYFKKEMHYTRKQINE